MTSQMSFRLKQADWQRTRIALLAVVILPISLFSAGCAPQASVLPPVPAVIAPDAEDKAAEAKIAYYTRMQKKVESQANKSYNKQVARNAQADKKGVVVGESGQSDISSGMPTETPSSTASSKAFAAEKDAYEVLMEETREENVAVSTSGKVIPDWGALSRQMLIDQTAVELVKGGLSQEEYAKATSRISDSTQQLAERQSSWENLRPLLFPGSN